jgi:predicted metalloprotease
MGGGGGAVVIVVLALLFGFDPNQVRQLIRQVPVAPRHGSVVRHNPEEDRLASFTKVILRDTEVVWEDLFRRMGRRYRDPILVLFSGSVQSACGLTDSAVGPFYCPGDQRVFIDLSFYQDMQRDLNAPGDFARAYVIAHEVGHHVQNLLGYSQLAQQGRRRGKAEANRMSVRLELQADYFAGVWAHHGQERYHFLEPGDVESALHAAFEIGDDRLQRKARGYVVLDSFTHGSSRQRMAAFSDGQQTGDVAAARKFFDR